MDTVFFSTSNIANSGNGLFANQDFEKGVIITGYEGTLTSLEDYTNDSDYALRIDDQLIVGNPVYTNSSQAAQFINDIRAITKFSDIEHYIDSIPLINSYLVKYGDQYIAMSIKEIKKGEELYFHYGINYWISKNKIAITDDTLACYLEEEQEKLYTYLTILNMLS